MMLTKQHGRQTQSEHQCADEIHRRCDDIHRQPGFLGGGIIDLTELHVVQDRRNRRGIEQRDDRQRAAHRGHGEQHCDDGDQHGFECALLNGDDLLVHGTALLRFGVVLWSEYSRFSAFCPST